jgi:hypothetical protein
VARLNIDDDATQAAQASSRKNNFRKNSFRKNRIVTEITQPCVHTCDGLFICQLCSLPDLLEETECKEDTPLTLPFCIVRFPLTVDNSDMN